tara:strand:+ start:1438 stop:1677 length:240 start_codon:yes stop_codon:yes gene_type:complete
MKNISQYLDTIQHAKEVLNNEGFNTSNLWQVEDVTQIYDCTDEQAQEVLKQALSSRYIVEKIFEEIDIVCEELKLNKKE